ncbi:hypothetical protein [Mangrovimonas sp. ST2L15]|uniref:hypothetical protein n=1 Tax=Mangrovimonas sp. ST2L15 TaxID=1645916 RepID=UPI0006B46C8A|nr:hypothetical protein [Mangrovimonas sp. ST2L15]
MIKSILPKTILFLSLGTTLLAQKPNTLQTESAYSNYFSLDKEVIHTQVNKLLFFPTEILWFKTYIYNIKTQLPYLTTVNIYTEIFDEEGKLLSKKLWYAENGCSHGNIELSKFEPGNYYLKVTTNWMKNFHIPESSVTAFQIIGEEVNQTTNSLTSLPKYDLQFLPEGGHCIANATNSIGFKVLRQDGKGEKIASGLIKDSSGKILLTFHSNDYGMGKFQLEMKSNVSYTAEILFDDGHKITKQLPRAEPFGINLITHSNNKETVYITIQTNAATLPNLLKKPYYFLIHRDGFKKRVDVNFSADKLSYTFLLNIRELMDGANIITVFNDQNKPILERVIFNFTNNLINSVDISKIEKGRDSTRIYFKKTDNDQAFYQLSISALPRFSKANNLKEDITYAFLLRPYIEGHLENAAHYFEEKSVKNIYDLDLLLLNQGWSKYSWNHIFNYPPNDKHFFEAGIQIKGKLTQPQKNYNEVLLFSHENELMISSELDKDHYFSFDNLFLSDSSYIGLSLKNDKGEILKKGIYYNVYPTKNSGNLDVPPSHNNLFKEKHAISFPDSFLIDPKTTQLDTVSLSTKKEYKPKNEIYRKGFNGKYVDLENRYDPFSRVIDIIRDQGFDISYQGTNVIISSRRAIGFAGRNQPAIYMDNRRLDASDMTILPNLLVSDIDEIYVSRQADVFGGLGGSINIFTKKSITTRKKNKETFNSSVLSFGFSIPEKYHSPFYNTSRESNFRDYSVLHWIPDITFNELGEFSIDLPNYDPGYELYIQGMGSNGMLISQTKEITIRPLGEGSE